MRQKKVNTTTCCITDTFGVVLRSNL